MLGATRRARGQGRCGQMIAARSSMALIAGGLSAAAAAAWSLSAAVAAAGDGASPRQEAIGALLRRPMSAVVTAEASPAQPAQPAPDPREGDPGYEQAQRLMKAVDALLQDTARQRAEARKLPSDKDFLMKPIWTETREDREKKIRDLLDAALSLVTDVPVVEV